MSQLSQLYLDILEAISSLSMQKGTTQKEIILQIQNQIGRPLTKKAVEKAARTLTKLVDEGVLVKKGRRYMLPNFSSKKFEDGDGNLTLEIKSESEDDESGKDWLSSDDDGPGPSRKKKITAKKTKKMKGKIERKKAKDNKSQIDSESFSSGLDRSDRSRSPINSKNTSSAGNIEPEGDNNGCEGQSKSQTSITSNGANDDKRKVDDYRYEISSNPSPSNTEMINVSRKVSYCSINCANQELEADQEDEILNKMKHERESYRKHLRRSPSKAKERQHKKKERDELIEKGRIEKFNRRSYSPEGDELDPRSSFRYGCDDKDI